MKRRRQMTDRRCRPTRTRRIDLHPARARLGASLRAGPLRAFFGDTMGIDTRGRKNRDPVDIAGQRFGRLVAVELRGRKNGKAAWLCRCDCGREIVTLGTMLRMGDSRSCGCYAADRAARLHRTHGASKSPEYKTWRSMLGRCHRKTDPGWKNYGGRGISVCERWRRSFQSFLADMGPRPSPAHSIDRINNDRGYGPGNCRWATQLQQQNNRRSTRLAMFRGRRLSLSEIAREAGVPFQTLWRRVRRAGWEIERAISTPSRQGPAS